MEQGRLGRRVRWAFTDRTGGTSGGPYTSANLGGHVGDEATSVETNRARLAASLGVPREQLLFMSQVHGREVRVVDGAPLDDATAVEPCDGQVTRSPDVVLAVLVADCVPVLLADPATGVVAAVHAGRPGVAQRIVQRAVEQMVSVGADPSAIEALLGPSVCGRCYEVPDPMRAEVAAVAPRAWATSAAGTAALDLRAGLVGQLADLGVAATTVGPCTRESAEHYSYRRDGTTGRFAGLVWLER
jgi:YfiH family protein